MPPATRKDARARTEPDHLLGAANAQPQPTTRGHQRSTHPQQRRRDRADQLAAIKRRFGTPSAPSAPSIKTNSAARRADVTRREWIVPVHAATRRQ